jgi:Uma2 family endonuclease
LVRLDRWQALSADERRSFAPLCPDLVVELASPSDEGPRGVTALREKMAAYQSNGAPQRLEPLQLLEATPEFSGLVLQLAEIWQG